MTVWGHREAENLEDIYSQRLKGSIKSLSMTQRSNPQPWHFRHYVLTSWANLSTPSPLVTGFFWVYQGFNIIFPLIFPCSCEEQKDLPCSPSQLLENSSTWARDSEDKCIQHCSFQDSHKYKALAEQCSSIVSLDIAVGRAAKVIHIDGLCLCPEGSETESLPINTFIHHSVLPSETTNLPSGQGRTASSPWSHWDLQVHL